MLDDLSFNDRPFSDGPGPESPIHTVVSLHGLFTATGQGILTPPGSEPDDATASLHTGVSFPIADTSYKIGLDLDFNALATWVDQVREARRLWASLR